MSDVFADDMWTDDVFWPWLAGHFEHGGRVRLPPGKVMVYLSLWSKNEGILRAISEKVKAGEVQARFTNPSAFVWRVHQQTEVERVLMSMLPFLTSSLDAAHEAMNRFARRRETIDRVKKRNREILIAWEIGHETQAQIAARLNTTPSVVAQVIMRNRAEHGITLRRPRTRIRLKGRHEGESDP